jgi:hypothetical protein
MRMAARERRDGRRGGWWLCLWGGGVVGWWGRGEGGLDWVVWGGGWVELVLRCCSGVGRERLNGR